MSRPLIDALLRAAAPACLMSAALLPVPAFAQQTVEPFRGAAVAPTALDEISVSATGVPTPTSQTGSSVTVLTSQTLEQQQRRTIGDALQQVPGLNVIQSGGPGSQTSVFMRGSNSNHTKVLIDGIDVSNPAISNGAFDFGQLLTDDLERIEVLRGPQSGLYGSDAIGGVISMTTKRGQGPTKAFVRVEGGSFGTFNQSGGVSGSQEGFDYSVIVSHFRSAATPVTPRELIPAGTRDLPNFYDNKTVSGKFGFQISDTFRINSITRFTDAQLKFTNDVFDPNTFQSAPANYRSLSDVSNLYLRNEAEWSPSADFHHVFGINYTNQYTLNRGPADPLNPPSETTGLGERLRFDYRGDYTIAPGNRLLWGAGREKEWLKTTDPVNNSGLQATNGNTFGFAEIQTNAWDRAFLVANVRHDANDQFGSATTFRVAPSFIVPGTETRLKGSVGTGFKAPTLSQLYQDFPLFNSFGNPNLKPEESFGFDAGAEQPLGNNVLIGGLYYQNDYKNLIEFVFGSFPAPSTYQNVGKAKSYGAEAFMAVKFTDTFNARVDYTNTVTKNEITDQELLRRPRHKGSFTANWVAMPGLTLSGTVIALGSFVDGNRDFSIPRLKNPGFTLVNLAANYDVNERWSVFGRVDNLFDKRYQNPTGFLGTGLAVYGGVRVNSF